MNYTFIILGIFLVIVLWVLYRSLMTPTSVVSTQTYLLTQPEAVKLSSLSNSNSMNFYYSLWIYVNNLSAANTRPVNNAQALANTIFYVADKNNEKIYLSLGVTPSTSLITHILLQGETEVKGKGYEITPNFALQRWEHVIISVNQSYLDLYLDGKLIKSANLGLNTQVPEVTGNIHFGTGDIYIAGFQRIGNPMDPQTAWNMYLTGSGTTKSPLNYGLSMTLSKNNTPESTITLF